MTLEERSSRSALPSDADHRHANSLDWLALVVQRKLRTAEQPETRRALTYVKEVIAACEAMHRSSPRGGPVDPMERLTALGNCWQALCEVEVGLVVTGDPSIRVPGRTAHCLALIVQELVSDAIRHPCPDGRTGRIDVELKRDDADHAILVVGNDWVGPSPGNPDPATELAEGRNLIVRLARVLDATVEDGPNDGAGSRVTVRLPIARLA
jgi:two-component sensor histidine kinase